MARTLAQTRLLEQQRDALNQKRDEVRLNARTREAANARADASDARNETQQARLQASNAQTKADNALNEARFARQQANQSDAEAASLRNEIAELNARPTDRGLVVTLGDVLFDTAKAGLKNTSSSHLEKLAIFLNAYPTRTAQIEGHTDEVGSDAANTLLSQKRADTVKAYLVAQGIASSRLVTSGKGENSPIATNATAEGRQQNRRVEVIIANAKE